MRVAGLKHRKIKEDAHVCDEIVISPFIPTVCFFLSSHCDILFVYRQEKTSAVNDQSNEKDIQFSIYSTGYQGRLCEIPIDPCQNNPCENSGTCLRTTYNNNFRCVCPTNYSGRTCQIYIENFCASSPCLANATCENLPNSYRCICPSTDICDRTKLPNVTCSNSNNATNQCVSGTCNQGKCSCFPGWTGDFCSEDVDECLNNPCNKQGTCYVSIRMKSTEISWKALFVEYSWFVFVYMSTGCERERLSESSMYRKFVFEWRCLFTSS